MREDKGEGKGKKKEKKNALRSANADRGAPGGLGGTGHPLRWGLRKKGKNREKRGERKDRDHLNLLIPTGKKKPS